MHPPVEPKQYRSSPMETRESTSDGVVLMTRQNQYLGHPPSSHADRVATVEVALQ